MQQDIMKTFEESVKKNDEVINYQITRAVQEAGSLTAEMGNCLSLGLNHCRDGRHPNINRMFDEWVDLRAAMEEIELMIYRGDMQCMRRDEINRRTHYRANRRKSSLRMERIFMQRGWGGVPKELFATTLDFFMDIQGWFEIHTYLTEEENLQRIQGFKDHQGTEYENAIKDYFLSAYKDGFRDIMYREQISEYIEMDVMDTLMILLGKMGRFCDYSSSYTDGILLENHSGRICHKLIKVDTPATVMSELAFIMKGINHCLYLLEVLTEKDGEVVVDEKVLQEIRDTVSVTYTDVAFTVVANNVVGDSLPAPDDFFNIRIVTDYGWWYIPVSEYVHY